jgi:hypothetical protein
MQSNSPDARQYEEAIKAMAADSQIIAECEAIVRDFAALESDRWPEEPQE